VGVTRRACTGGPAHRMMDFNDLLALLPTDPEEIAARRHQLCALYDLHMRTPALRSSCLWIAALKRLGEPPMHMQPAMHMHPAAHARAHAHAAVNVPVGLEASSNMSTTTPTRRSARLRGRGRASPAAAAAACGKEGIVGSHGVHVCCPLRCGDCGGHGCSKRPGGARACCAADISKTGKLCSATQGPPCTPPRHRWSQFLDNAMANATPTQGRSHTLGTTRGRALRATSWKASIHNISVEYQGSDVVASSGSGSS